MPSTINPSLIDETFPIAGNDNDSQGFRDNFTNTQTNFEVAKTEIEELQDNQNLVTAPTGSIGQAGDKVGMIAGDSGYIYLCTADYDGVSDIWIRSTVTVPW